jgi:ribose transport system ATP-binding protein
MLGVNNNNNEVLLQVVGISKSFPGVRALDKMDFDLYRGEVHVLLGENGAGKTTLVKILSGAYIPDEGSIIYKGHVVSFSGPRDAQVLGLATVYQELTLIPALSVAENVFLGNLPMKGGIVDWNRLHVETDRLFKEMGCEIDPHAQARDVGIAARQMVEIAKALARKADILIMDEPTSALTETERVRLFNLLRYLQSEGTAILYISHRLEELSEIGSRITVLRDGSKVGTVEPNKVSREELIKMMLGREWKTVAEERAQPENEVVLEVVDLTGPDNLKNINFSAHRGEIIGIAGLMGAGRTELCRCLFGVDKIVSGTIHINGNAVQIQSPENAIRLGLGYLTENREEGLLMRLSVAVNTMLASPDKVFHHVLLDRKKEDQIVTEQVNNLNIRLRNINQQVQFLSGGNQQKVVLARWLCSDAKILILDDPTRGVDIGAKEEIYKLIITLAQQGLTVLFISSELRELIRVAHRVLVMFGGSIVGDIPHEEVTLQQVMYLATGGTR